MSGQVAGSETVRTASEVVMTESWSTRWYTPLVAIGAVLLALLFLALAIVEVLVANAPDVRETTAWTTTPASRATAFHTVLMTRAVKRPFPCGVVAGDRKSAGEVHFAASCGRSRSRYARMACSPTWLIW
jgi:hypothetical protein